MIPRTRRGRTRAVATVGCLVLMVTLFLATYLPSDGLPAWVSALIAVGIPLGGWIFASIIYAAFVWTERGEDR
jgi:hypothetical protein